MKNKMDIKTARHVAARIWCDPDYEHVGMNVNLAEKIAQMLMDNANGVHSGCDESAKNRNNGSLNGAFRAKESR